MGAKALVLVGVVLALGAGVGVAATQTTSAGGTAVCVNTTNGLVRVASVCRDGEYSLTIGGGGGGNAQATQNGTFTVVEGATDSGKALPLTGVTVSGRCDTVPSPFGGVPDGIVAVAVVRAASGTTMDVFKNGNPVGQTSAVVGGFGAPPGMTTGGAGTADTILTSNGATATITVGGYGDPTSRTCKFLWQGVEAAN
jgi:hypothetical protein